MVRYAKIKKMDTSNAQGISSSIFFSGCNFKCKGCFNEVAQDFNYGEPFTKEIEDLFISYVNNTNVVSANILGGEVFHQDLNIIYDFIKKLKTKTCKPIWIWSGFTFETLIEDNNKLKILKLVDVLIDGQFDILKKDLSLRYKGSVNQRVIDVQKSLDMNGIIIYENGGTI